ncbi:C4-dicarboxylate transporter DctA [Heyndrickxia coagulans]|uniref:C4-dicarboxylate transporter DctA n=1 Tax=Heyndrickxia coagulans TaxID=1398 RepID=UPI001061583D|nr:C4-dicarboxylate transporter DctA [Heyndrickxia coagulans]MBF8419056.1 C4-dicarboxylate transporter DctA [Heyndrickxia coagulans]
MRINFRNLTVQVVIGIILGIIVGLVSPKFGAELNILAQWFIKLIKMLVPPIIFFTVIIGIGGMGDLKKVGRIGGKALIYFEVVSTVALAIGLVIVNLIQPGHGIDTSHAKTSQVSQFVTQAKDSEHGFIGFISGIIPESIAGAFVKGDLLPILFFAVLFGVAAASLGERAKPVIRFFEDITEIFFKIVGIVMKVSPIAAFGAMAYTVGQFGASSLINLGELMGSVYLTMIIFIVLVLGGIAKAFGFNIFKLIAYIKEELLLVLGTSSSESAMPSLMRKLEKFGCSKSVVGLVVPTGYSFNLDGTAIYLSMASIFIAQAYNVHLTIGHQIMLLLILMLTSKGAAGVTGSGFITLAATLSAFPVIPVAGIALLIGVDRFMSESRALTNIIGNAVATVVISKTEKEFDKKEAPETVAHPTESIPS